MALSANFEDRIRSWFDARRLDLPDDFIPRAGIFHELIQEWSKRINIVSKNDLGMLLERHILDSLVPINEIPESGNMVDIGSGAGFPAVPITLLRPRMNIIMIESVGKKAVFLNEAISRLELARVSIWHGRFEDFLPVVKFEIATIRAVKLTDKIKAGLKRIMRDSGKIIYYNKFGQFELISLENR
jgi:16S rRNA (guanine527-N7)-methyltransferase